MKNEPLFKFVALAVVLGLLMAFASAARADNETFARDGAFSQTASTVPDPSPWAPAPPRAA